MDGVVLGGDLIGEVSRDGEGEAVIAFTSVILVVSLARSTVLGGSWDLMDEEAGETLSFPVVSLESGAPFRSLDILTVFF